MFINKDLVFDSELPAEQIWQFDEIFPEGCKINQENLLNLIKHGIRLDLLLGRFLYPEDRKTIVIQQGVIEDLEHLLAGRQKDSPDPARESGISLLETAITGSKREIVEIVMKIASI